MHQRYHTYTHLDDTLFVPNLNNTCPCACHNGLKNELNTLETEIKIKDRLLEEKSKHIINITSENLRLKQEMKSLQRQLRIKSKSILLKKKRRKSKKFPKNTKLKHIKSRSSSVPYDSGDYLDGESIDNLELPYLIPTISKSVSDSSITSNLSEQACRLSFPKTIQDSNPPPFVPKPAHSILSPIAEHNCDSIESNIELLIKVSDNNCNIETDEWNDIECCETSKETVNINTNLLYVISDDNESSSVSCPETDGESIESYDDEMDAVSYMSDNTIDLLDIKNKDLSFDHSNNSESELRLPQKLSAIKMFSFNQISCGQLSVSGCDTVIQSPINLLKGVKGNGGAVNLNFNSVISVVDVGGVGQECDGK